MTFSAKNEHLGSEQLIYIYLKIFIYHIHNSCSYFIYDYNARKVSRVTHDKGWSLTLAGSSARQCLLLLALHSTIASDIKS